MCNEITHPAQREVKWLRGSMEMGKGGKFGSDLSAQEVREFDLYKTRTIN